MGGVPTIVRSIGTISAERKIGFSSIPDQVRERSIERGFELNILVVGRRGCGCSTLVNSLFEAPLIDRERPNTAVVTVGEIIEGGISLKVSTVTYHAKDISPILDYIDSANKEYFENEHGPYNSFKDNRVYACLYLIPSDSVLEEEIEVMYKLSQRCNFVPVIPKADMYTSKELTERKAFVKNMLAKRNISFFSPRMGDNDDFIMEMADIAENIPFAVIASETKYDRDGEILTGRDYPWGFINIRSEKRNDFKRLQQLLIHTSMEDLISRTNHLFYDEYRKRIFDLENDCSEMRETRYFRLRDEMMKIFDEKHKIKMEALKKEESKIDKMCAEESCEAPQCS